MRINLRTKDGWSGYRKYANKLVTEDEQKRPLCPECKAVLWLTPGGTVYCDKVHALDYCGVCGTFENVVNGICTDPQKDCERVWHDQQHDQGDNKSNPGCGHCK